MATELRELSRALLEAQVAVVAALGRLVAAVAGPEGDVLLPVSPRSLHKALDAFRGHLWDTLGHHGVAAPDDAPGPGWACAWRRSVAAVAARWTQLATEAARLRDACGAAATSEREAAATGCRRAGDLRSKVKAWATSLCGLVVTASNVPLVTDREEEAALQEHRESVEGATKAVERAIRRVEESTVASSEAKAATERARRAEAALGPLEGLVAACAEAAALHRQLGRRAGDLAAAWARAGAARGVPEALVATVAQAKELWEASASLFTRHLRGTLGDILRLLPSGPGGPGGPSDHSVAQQCQKAKEDIPKLLQGE